MRAWKQTKVGITAPFIFTSNGILGIAATITLANVFEKNWAAASSSMNVCLILLYARYSWKRHNTEIRRGDLSAPD